MRILIVGLGVQGYKRRDFANADYVASVDPVNKEADYKNIQDVSCLLYTSDAADE